MLGSDIAGLSAGFAQEISNKEATHFINYFLLPVFLLEKITYCNQEQPNTDNCS